MCCPPESVSGAKKSTNQKITLKSWLTLGHYRISFTLCTIVKEFVVLRLVQSFDLTEESENGEVSTSLSEDLPPATREDPHAVFVSIKNNINIYAFFPNQGLHIGLSEKR